MSINSCITCDGARIPGGVIYEKNFGSESTQHFAQAHLNSCSKEIGTITVNGEERVISQKAATDVGRLGILILRSQNQEVHCESLPGEAICEKMSILNTEWSETKLYLDLFHQDVSHVAVHEIGTKYQRTMFFKSVCKVIKLSTDDKRFRVQQEMLRRLLNEDDLENPETCTFLKSRTVIEGTRADLRSGIYDKIVTKVEYTREVSTEAEARALDFKAPWFDFSGAAKSLIK